MPRLVAAVDGFVCPLQPIQLREVITRSMGKTVVGNSMLTHCYIFEVLGPTLNANTSYIFHSSEISEICWMCTII